MHFMKHCAHCGGEMAESARFCPGCGQATDSFMDMPTVAAPQPEGGVKKTPSAPTTPARISSSRAAARFTAGDMLAGRYRISGRLGRGGMGEVYAAEDLTLGQPVALKFLPAASAHDSTYIERFRAEVRNARQVSHPNVCRVYDIGEVDGQPFISMEYVDGEDLSSLLKRIGLLPGPKALQFARQLCAGLGAAHDKGVLHRDLKPANVMIDGEGRARITDFGLAVQGEEAEGRGEMAGTPAYMSPEQHAGKAATAKSDLYSLGMVLYEVFTGKKAFDGTTAAELRRKHTEEPPPPPSSVAPDIDPAVERVILRCLEKDPRQRPASALAVAAALPGGDPLAAALAAGETPSPALVAAAGESEGFEPRLAVACLAFVVVGVIAACFLSAKLQMTGIVPLGNSPDVLAAKAQDLMRQFGYKAAPTDSAYGYNYDQDYLQNIEKHNKAPNRWEQVKAGNPSAIFFWFRTSPRYLEPQDLFSGPASGIVSQNDPPRNISGMTLVRLDPSGQLEYFMAVPPQVIEAAASEKKNDRAEAAAPSEGKSAEADWSKLFAAAGLDITKFKSATPEWIPPVWSDTREAWIGREPSRPNVPLRVEAAAYQGRPVYFQLIWPWTQPLRMQAANESARNRVRQAVQIILFLTVLTGAVFLTRRTLRLGRGDRHGAFRLGIFVLIVFLIAWVATAHHVPTRGELGLFVMASSAALFFAGVVWLLYIGLEPYVRRRWPNAIISWSRALAGQFRDPWVGRDVLIGLALGVGMRLWFSLDHFADVWFGKVSPEPVRPELIRLSGAGSAIGTALGNIPGNLGAALAVFFLFFLLQLLLRKEWRAGGVFVLIFVGVSALTGQWPWVDAVFAAVAYGSLIFILIRFGLMPLVTFFVANTALVTSPLTTHLTAWYALPTYISVGLILALAIYGFKVSLAGRPIFSGAALDE